MIGLGILCGAVLVDKPVYGKWFAADPRFRRTTHSDGLNTEMPPPLVLRMSMHTQKGDNPGCP